MAATVPVLNPNLTKAGLALMPSPQATGFAITLTHIALGTGLYTPVLEAATGLATQIALVNEVARYAISSGTNPTTTSIQTGTTVTDTDINGKSPNGLAIGEIGWFGVPTSTPNATPTLVAVWSRATGGALFTKAAQIDVPFAYALDVGVFPANSVTVTIGTDVPGMVSLIQSHEAKTDPHAQYVLKLLGTTMWVATGNYGIGAKVTAANLKTYRSLVAANLNFEPSANPSKWERWALTPTEMLTEFVPPRTAYAMGTADATGSVRVENPAGAYLGLAGVQKGALRITFPAGAQALDTLFRMRVDVLDSSATGSFSAFITGHVSLTTMAWENVQVSILGQQSARDLAVRFGNDGTKPCLWIGELASSWNAPRVIVSDFEATLNTTPNASFWAAGWAINVATAFSAVTTTLSNNLVFGQSDIAHVAGLQAALDAKQPNLNFTPVQQGGGVGQLTNKVYMGWSGTGLKATVDATDLGTVAFLNSPVFTGVPQVPTAAAGTNNTQAASTAFVVAAIQQAQVGQISLEPRTTPRAGYLALNGALLNRADYPVLWAVAQSSGALVSDATWGANYFGCFSTGDGVSTFRIPELRGEFIRCWDNARGADPGRAIGTFQGSQNLLHAHTASSGAAGGHAHSAYTDAQGYHAHAGSYVAADGYHDHAIPNVGSVQAGSDNGGAGGPVATGYGSSRYPQNVSAGGTHAHGLGIVADGSHAHNVGVYAVGDHTHAVYIAGDGGGEARPRNVALGAFIRAY